MTLFRQIESSFKDSSNLDAFGRLRVTDPYTIFDSKQIFDDLDIPNTSEKYPLFFDNQEISGTGTTTTFNINRASTTLGVANLTAGTRVRQSKQRFNYQPGKSQLILFTCVWGDINSGITKRYGYFDENNGWFFESNGTDLAVVRRTNVSGTPVDNRVGQANWNIDRLDGTGPSGITLDLTKAQILVIDFQWLGVGRIRFALDIDGVVVPIHQFLIANNLDSVSVSSPNLPIRGEISNDGTGPADSIELICSAIMVEGQLQSTGVDRTYSNGNVHINANTIGTYYALLGLRLRPTHLGAMILPTALSILARTNDDFRWVVCINPTVTGGLTYSNLQNSAVEVAAGTDTTTVTDLGTELASGYVNGNWSDSAELHPALRLGSKIDGTRDELVIAVMPLSPNLDIVGALNWREML